MADFFIVSLLLLAFLPSAANITSGARAYLLAPAISAIAALLAGVIHVMLDLSVIGIWSALAASQLALLFVGSLRARTVSALKIDKSDFSAVSSFSSAIVLSIVALISTPAPLTWDARSIWFHHATWLNGPAIYFREAQFLPAGSWPDYPLLGPSMMALAFQVSGGESNLWLASRVIGVLVLLLSGWVVVTLVSRWNPTLHFGIVGALTFLFGLAFTVLADGYFNAGYMDALQAASVVAVFASVLALPSKLSLKDLLIPSMMFLVAANVKQEGFWFATGAIILGLAYQLMKKNFIAVGLIGVVVLGRTSWSAFQSHLGMPDNGHTAEVVDRLPLLLAGDPATLGNLELIWSSWGAPRSLGYLLIALFASSVLLFLWGKRVKWQDRVVIPVLLLAAPTGVLTVAMLTYALGQSGGLEWWLGTSYTRITATFEALALFSAAFTVIALGPEWKPKIIPPAKPQSKKTSKKKSRR